MSMSIREIQSALVSLGYAPGAVDGANGPHTAAAVRLFQADHGLTVDGIAGARTQAALQAALAQGPPAPPGLPPLPSPVGPIPLSGPVNVIFPVHIPGPGSFVPGGPPVIAPGVPLPVPVGDLPGGSLAGGVVAAVGSPGPFGLPKWLVYGGGAVAALLVGKAIFGRKKVGDAGG